MRYSLNDYRHGLVTQPSPFVRPKEALSKAQGIDLTRTGLVRKTLPWRRACEKTSGFEVPLDGSSAIRGLHYYRPASGNGMWLVVQDDTAGQACMAKLSEIGGVLTLLESGLSEADGSPYWVFANAANWAFCAGGGTLYCTNGTAFVPAGVSVPQSAPTATEGTSGALVAGEYSYRVCFKHPVTEAVGNPSSAGTVTIAANMRINLTNIPTLSGYHRVIYRQAPGDGDHYLLATIADDTTTTYEDNTPTSGTIPLHTDHDAPPEGCIALTYAGGYLFGIFSGEPRVLRVSKQGEPWYWPSTTEYQLDLANDGTALATLQEYVIAFSRTTVEFINYVYAQFTQRLDQTTVGCRDNRAVLPRADALYFFGTDGEFYEYLPNSDLRPKGGAIVGETMRHLGMTEGAWRPASLAYEPKTKQILISWAGDIGTQEANIEAARGERTLAYELGVGRWTQHPLVFTVSATDGHTLVVGDAIGNLWAIENAEDAAGGGPVKRIGWAMFNGQVGGYTGTVKSFSGGNTLVCDDAGVVVETPDSSTIGFGLYGSHLYLTGGDFKGQEWIVLDSQYNPTTGEATFHLAPDGPTPTAGDSFAVNPIPFRLALVEFDAGLPHMRKRFNELIIRTMRPTDQTILDVSVQVSVDDEPLTGHDGT